MDCIKLSQHMDYFHKAITYNNLQWTIFTMISHTNSKLLEPRWAPMFIRWKSSYSEALPKIHQHSGRIEHIIYLILLYLLYFLVSCCIPIPEASSYIPFQLISYHPKIGNINTITNQSPSELSVSVESPSTHAKIQVP